MPVSSILYPLVSRWIAGEYLEQAMLRAEKSNKKGYSAMLNLLGEHVDSPRLAVYYLHHYIELIHEMKNHNIKGSITLKPSQLGMEISKQVCRNNISQIAEVALEHNYPVWIDMEKALHVQSTLDIYFQLLSRFPNMGISIQANLKRSETDLKELMKYNANIRLVKGAYKEHPGIALQRNGEIKKQFHHLLKVLFLSTSRSKYKFAIATHDKEMINAAKKLTKNRLPNLEFQLLLGVGRGSKKDLLKNNYVVSEYIPYGRKWLPYVFRRIREKKNNFVLLANSIFE